VLDMLDWSADLPEVTCRAGSVVIREGDVHGKLFVLLDGALEISRAGTVITLVDAPGAIFGEMSALLGSAATATVRAVRDTRLRRSDDPQGFLDGHPLVARAVATTLARRLDTINGYLVDLRRQYGDRDNLGMVDTVLESLRHHQAAPCEPGSEREPDCPY
jgi:CRP/FNR family transcriptional regulator, cyclic AMP receptor protein